MKWMIAALITASAGSAAAQIAPTRADIANARDDRLYANAELSGVDAVHAELIAGLGKAPIDTLADRLASRHGLPAAPTRRLVRAWVVAMGRSLDDRQRDWQAPVRAELHALAPALRATPLGLGLLAAALSSIGDDCPAADFTALMAGSRDEAADAWTIAANSLCTAMLVRAADAAGARAMPMLLHLVDDLPPRDRLPLLAWLTSDAALARVRAAERPQLAVRLWRDYLTQLGAAGLQANVLAAYDTLPADLRAAVLSPAPNPPVATEIDGIAISLPAEERDRSLASIAPPIEPVAEALALAGRTDEARALLATLPGLAAARAAAACAYAATGPEPGNCPTLRDLPGGALFLDHLLNHPGEDPYPLAETLLGADGLDSGCSASARRLFDGGSSPCRPPEPDSSLHETSTSRDDVAAAEAVLGRLLPDFAARRQALLGAHDQPPPGDDPQQRRASIAAVPPDYGERPLPAEYRGPAPGRPPRGLAPLPDGFELVRAERIGNRAVAISLSQTLDPNGEVSGGGYWVHLSADGGRHWQPPLHTGLADHFPYVVKPASRLPLLDGDTLQLAVDIAEIDTASITYPPVGLVTRRTARDLQLSIPLATLRQDSDGDGITDVAARHLLIDRAARPGATPFVVGSDGGDGCAATAMQPELAARLALLNRFVGTTGAALVQPVDRPADEILPPMQRAAASRDQPVFLLADPAGFRCLQAARMIIVYTPADVAAMRTHMPDFRPLELPTIILNRARDRGYAVWSTGWTGGTMRLRLVGGKWQIDTISSWIT